MQWMVRMLDDKHWHWSIFANIINSSHSLPLPLLHPFSAWISWSEHCLQGRHGPDQSQPEFTVLWPMRCECCGSRVSRCEECCDSASSVQTPSVTTRTHIVDSAHTQLMVTMIQQWQSDGRRHSPGVRTLVHLGSRYQWAGQEGEQGAQEERETWEKSKETASETGGYDASVWWIFLREWLSPSRHPQQSPASSTIHNIAWSRCQPLGSRSTKTILISTIMEISPAILLQTVRILNNNILWAKQNVFDKDRGHGKLVYWSCGGDCLRLCVGIEFIECWLTECCDTFLWGNYCWQWDGNICVLLTVHCLGVPCPPHNQAEPCQLETRDNGSAGQGGPTPLSIWPTLLNYDCSQLVLCHLSLSLLSHHKPFKYFLCWSLTPWEEQWWGPVPARPVPVCCQLSRDEPWPRPRPF